MKRRLSFVAMCSFEIVMLCIDLGFNTNASLYRRVHAAVGYRLDISI
jgi:hypothetical protein